MTEERKLQLSALMDGELESSPSRFLLRQLEHDRELAGQWQRWHLVRDCLRHQGSAPLRADFAARISAALADEREPRGAWRGALLRWGGGTAIAASVALAALLAVPPSPVPTADDPLPIVAQPSAPAEVVMSGRSERDLRPDLAPVTQTVAATMTPGPYGFSPSVQIDPRVDAWLIRHNAALTGPMQDSFVPLIPLVSPQRAAVQRAVAVSPDAGR